MALVNPIVETGLILSWNWNNKYGIVQVQPRPQPGDQIICKPPDKRSFYTGVVLSTNADGTYDVEFAAEGFFARVLQHEVDHLDGVLFLDRMADFQTLAFVEEYQRYWLEETD